MEGPAGGQGKRIARSILVLRGHKVMLDHDLAALYSFLSAT